MEDMWSSMKSVINRRSFVKTGLSAAGVTAAGAGLLSNSISALGEEGPEEHSGRLTKGDAALLRFAAAAEILETDFWVQYNELGGIQDSEVPGGSGNPAYTTALEKLDSDMAQYVHDNTDDEFTHQNFLNAYLASKGADTVSLERFRTLTGSSATGSSGKLRLTNLTQLTLDTSWWTRYRSSNHNPDLDPTFKFPHAVPSLAVGQHTGPMTTPKIRTSFRQSRTQQDFTFPRSNRVETVSIPRWRKGPPVSKCCESLSALAPPKQCTFKPGRTRLAMPQL